MRAVVITKPGGPEVLEVREVAQPKIAPDEVLVRVQATALNRADLLQRQGHYPAPPGWPADIPGLEFAGVIAGVGERATRWNIGARVFGLVGGGAHAEFVAIHERAIAEIPQHLNWSEAAAVPEAFITAHDALFTHAGLRPGERVLIHAVGSGVGLAAVQLARGIGAEPYGITRTPEKLLRAGELALAAGAVVNDPIAELPDYVERWTRGKGFDVVLDLAGGPYLRAAVEALGPKGRLMLVGTVAGGKTELPISVVMRKRLTIRGTVMRARPLEERIDAILRFAKEVVPLIESGALQPTIDSEFTLDEIREAHERLESNETFGKVVIRVG